MSRRTLKQAVEGGTWRQAVAANVSAFTAATWDANLRRDERLLVPIDVRALVVSAAGDITRVPTVTTTPADDFPRPPELFAAARPRKPGVYLHFAMPDALTRGARQSAATADDDNPLGLAPLPDRFVVVRLLHGGARREAWVLEADRAIRTPLARWQEGMQHPAPGENDPQPIPPQELTAVAGGDVAWAATVDAVIDRFAIFDDLLDLPERVRADAVLTYFVAGWWSRPELDPLAGVRSIGGYHRRLQSLGWTAPMLRGKSTRKRMAEDESRSREGGLPGKFETPGRVGKKGEREVFEATDLGIDGVKQPSTLPIVPSLTLLHGTAFGVRADGNGPDLQPAAAAIELAFGSHPSAAIAALLAEGDDADRDSAERLVSAFQMNLLATIDKPDGLSTVDEERHARAFVARSGGARPGRDRIRDGDPVGWPGQTAAASVSTDVPASARENPAASGKKVTLDFMESRSEKQPPRRATTATVKPYLEELRGHGLLRKPPAFRDVRVPLPRYHYPADVAFLIRGSKRSPRHGGDGRFDAQGRLACRLPAGVIRGYSGVLDADDLPLGLRALGSGAIPSEVDLLLREAVLSDPYRIAELAQLAAAKRKLPPGPVETRLQAEAALRYHAAAGDSGPVSARQAETLRRASILEGEEPSLVASHLWSQPWVPLWCEWEVALRFDDAREGWTLDVLDLELGETGWPEIAAEIHRGRTLLTSSSAKALAANIRQWILEEEQRDEAGQSQLTDQDEEVLSEAARVADGADFLAGTFEGIREALLGLDPVLARMERASDPPLRPKPVALPRLFAGGTMDVTRLRIVDAFGRHVDVPQARLDAAKVPVANRLADSPTTLVMPPRFQCPARLMLRLVDASAADGARPEESRVDQEHPELMRSPLAGFLLPDHVDEALEFFDANGEPIGQVMHDPLTGSVLWEGAPGTPGPLGAPPAGGHPAVKHLARLATGLVEADARARAGSILQRESALSALLRVIDTTLWTTDPFGSTGTGSIASIVGRPIAVVRASLWLDTLSDVDALDYALPADRELRRRAFEDLAARVIRLRLGEVTRSDDGLLAYAIDDAYDRLHVISRDVRLAARASGPGEGHFRAFGEASKGAPPPRAVVHPYLSGDPAIDLHPGQFMRLTLLMVPGLSVSATCGVLPRKRIALARDWFEETLERLSPSIRVGPVLFEATAEGVRMPKVAALGPRQRFTHKPNPISWRDDVILAATQTAYLPDEPAAVREGWIRVSPVVPDNGSGS